jgi:hypothetical protein
VKEDVVVRARTAAIAAVENQFTRLVLVNRNKSILLRDVETIHKRAVQGLGNGCDILGRLACQQGYSGKGHLYVPSVAIDRHSMKRHHHPDNQINLDYSS